MKRVIITILIFLFGIGCGFVESSFGNASEEVLLVHHTLVGEDGAAGVRGLCTLLEPFQGFVEIQVDGSRIRVRIVGTNLFDELAIAWRPAVCDNDMIKGVAFLTVARKSDFYRHLFECVRLTIVVVLPFSRNGLQM